MSQRKTYHVTPGTDSGWRVTEENASKPLSKHDTKADAVNRAEEVAKNQDLVLLAITPLQVYCSTANSVSGQIDLLTRIVVVSPNGVNT